MPNEIIFYNGFNLLVDIIIAGAVFFFTSRYYWLKGYGESEQDRADSENQMWDDYADELRRDWHK